jgi:hypothetical protein
VIKRGKLVVLGTIEEIMRERPELAGLGLEDLFLTLTGEPGEVAR